MTRTIFIAAALALTVTLPAVPANAQTAIRTYVSVSGSDTNPCSLTAPCRHFSAAVAATSAGGEVDALDPGGYGSFTISQAITIDGEGWSYVAPPSGDPAITISAGSGDVVLRGLSLNGIGVTGANGIEFNSGTTLTVQNSVIQNFASGGILFYPSTSTTTKLSVLNTLISDNGGQGIFIDPTDAGAVNAVLDHVDIENNASSGLSIETYTETINVTVSDSVIANNGAHGITAGSSSVGPVNVMVRNTTIANNGQDGLMASGTGVTIRVTRSTITGNTTAWIASSGVVSSYADNNIDGNGGGSPSANTAPPAIGYK
jgi:hypothetical protein